jgi:hypothetical protein
MMDTKVGLKAIHVKDLKAGDLFGHAAGVTLSFAVALAKNQFGYEHVLLSSMPGHSSPRPMGDLLEQDETVVCYENVTFSVSRQFGHLHFGSRTVKAGSIIFTTEGRFLRCERDTTHFDLNIQTGEFKQPSSHLPTYWSDTWRIVGSDDEVIFEWPIPLI